MARGGNVDHLAKRLLILTAWGVCFAQLAHTQPNIPRENIPPNIAPEVREQVERLYSEDGEERVRAAGRLGSMGEKAIPAVPFLMDLLDDPLELFGKAVTPFMAATSALIRIGEPPIEVLTEALKHENTYVQTSAIRFLGSTKDARAVAPLVAALDHQLFEVRYAAASTLGNMIWDGYGVDLLLAALEDKSWRVRSSAALALGWKKVTRAKEALVAVSNDEETHVRNAAALALWWLDESTGVDQLIDALTDEIAFVRREAARALGRSNDRSAVVPLISALDDESGGVRAAAASALANLEAARAVDPLIAALKDERQDVRSAAASALGTIGDARAVQPLIDALADNSFHVRNAAACSLGHLKDSRAVNPLIAALKGDRALRSTAARALGQLGDNRAVKPLMAFLGKGGLDSQESVTLALVEIGEPAIEPLIAAVGSRNFYVRWHAAFALRKITGKEFGQDPRKWRNWWKANKNSFD
jgi:HEAT repeat protein